MGEVLKLLEERFGLTQLEKIDHFIKKIKTEFKVSKDDNEQSWWDKCDTFLTDFEELDLKDNMNKFLWRWIMTTSKEGKILDESDDKTFLKELKEINEKICIKPLKSYTEKRKLRVTEETSSLKAPSLFMPTNSPK